MIIVREEKSKSRSGKHAFIEKSFIVSKKHGVKEIKGKVLRQDKKLYSKGYAKILAVHDIDENSYIVKVRMVKNLQGLVKGEFVVVNNEGIEVFRAVYRKLKIRKGLGDPKYGWIVEAVAKHLRIPVKRISLLHS